MKTIIDIFQETVEKYSENKAVSDESGSLTYKMLDEISDVVADEIIGLLKDNASEKNSTDNYNIGVVYPREKEVLCAFLGIMRSGNCYYFVNPDVPQSRLEFIASDAGTACLITSKKVTSLDLAAVGVPVIYMEDILKKHQELRSFPNINRTDDKKAAFITYTSGSTGNPKGVVDTYYYIRNHINARHSYYEPGPDECIGNIVSFSYAASTYDLFSGLTVGCNLYIFSDQELLNQNLLVSRIKANNITTMFMIPSMIPVVFAPGAELPIKCIITAGEKAKQIPDISARMVEIYGSSEAAAVTGRVTTKQDPWNLLGKPTEGTTIYLLDEEGNLITTPDTVGEVCIVNDALAIEYRGREEETKEKFVPCPFDGHKRMYKSGDLMQFDREGNYYYCGRKDNMTKINGQRIEMGEVEATIVKHPDVFDAVCVILTRNNKSMLVCYYIPENGKGELPSDELSAFVSDHLPKYMVPLYWIPVDSFPKNVNGKVERKSLPEPDFDSYTLGVEPESYEERQLLKAARALLPDISFGVTDDLLRLGMDSILAVQFVSEIEKYDSRITVSDVMRRRNIRDILNSSKEIMWLTAEFDPAKPTMVLDHGIIPVSGLSLLYDEWGKIFNIIAIEPFIDHIDNILEKYDYEKLIDFYFEEIEKILEDKESLFGFAGFSFGGQIAISLADRWQKKYGEYKQVFMGDTIVPWIYPGKVFPVLTEDDPFIKMVAERSKAYGDSVVREPIDMIIKKQNLTLDLMRTMKRNTPYDGPVLFIDAKKDYDDDTEKLKLSVVSGLYKNATVIEFPEYFHNDLYMNSDMFTFYKNYFRMLLKKRNRLEDKHFEKEYYADFGTCPEDMRDFDKRYSALIKGLDDKSVKTVGTALKRIKDLKSIKDHLLPAFSDDEMKELKKLEEFEKAIKREGDNCFSYKEYKLSEPRFEACVFLDRCGVENLDNPEYFRDKDIIDAGAFIGDSALIFSGLTNGKVYSFEPTGENYESLLKTIELNGLKNVEACNYALGAEKGTADMTNAIVSSTNSYVEKSRMPYTATESVKVIRLDDFVREHGLNVGLIKTDVEGAEQLLLKGAMETIKSQRPTLLISIYHNTSDFYDIKPMLEGLDLGYTFKIRHPAIGTVLMETMLIAEVNN